MTHAPPPSCLEGRRRQIGIRGYEAPGFFEFADEVGLNLYTMNDVEGDGIIWQKRSKVRSKRPLLTPTQFMLLLT